MLCVFKDTPTHTETKMHRGILIATLAVCLTWVAVSSELGKPQNVKKLSVEWLCMKNYRFCGMSNKIVVYVVDYYSHM